MSSSRKRRFKPGPFALAVKRSRAGLGLFAEEKIPKGACVIEYTGRPMTNAEAEASRSKYIFEVNKTLNIDGSSRTNRARYINHSCKPNCEIEIVHGRIFVMARRGIRAGEELSYDYDTDYFDYFIKPNGCRCVACASGL
ncbi:MAG: SET domain-containing protein [Minisyncoccia bacterium]